ncbi:uncharacterized protein LOC111703942 [Eurytemora carolleeae]|uniref:uncharacterized protein LOC111703942 n=1 Tax=Eurytemora carolleeae TaxID=1294199 RepID=UPI000C771309|nr:uncharacterized protein LOC111703942 [Eurytemora carolleeae]|eukprot:XP_023331807.1 uncharacterized protein LOC111703942 [Eurytemora affinis]
MLIIKGFIFCILIMQAKCRDDLCSLQHFCECPPYLTQAHAPLYFTKHNYIQQYAIVGKYKELHCCLGPRFQEILWSKDGVQFPWTQDRHAIVYRFGDEYIEHTTRNKYINVSSIQLGINILMHQAYN